eukprot:TRINITY_DN1639_c0_g2_i20.p1 TRINITY_DN1639_c0_g2~~TRINITY_DN1639_c0_g2_i20.p1  ORF type:complete len:170 (+),score=80.81 TRINITY_DN1639_c0_g2_i20:124-633(+)
MEKQEVTAQELLHTVNELLELVQPIRKTLTGFMAVPDILRKSEQREAELEQNSLKYKQEALAAKKAGNQSAAILALKKKKMQDEELEKFKNKKVALISEVKVKSKGVLDDPLYEGIKNAIIDVKLGKRGRYKMESPEEMNAKLADYYQQNSSEDPELLAELEALEHGAK